MKLKNINKNEKLTSAKALKEIGKQQSSKVFKELDYPIEKGDKVQVLKNYQSENSSLGTRTYEVERISLKNFPDMSVWVLYLKLDTGVQNPYLAHQFKVIANASQ